MPDLENAWKEQAIKMAELKQIGKTSSKWLLEGNLLGLKLFLIENEEIPKVYKFKGEFFGAYDAYFRHHKKTLEDFKREPLGESNFQMWLWGEQTGDCELSFYFSGSSGNMNLLVTPKIYSELDPPKSATESIWEVWCVPVWLWKYWNF